MQGIVIIPAFDRPAFLQICIDHIIAADNSDKMRYVFCLDHGFDRQNLKIIEKFPYLYAINERTTKIVGVGKQSNNVLMGLLSGLNYCEGEPIFYIEDDVFIGKDFFTFGRELIKAEPDILCAILSRNVNSQDNTVQDMDAYYVKENTNVYQGIGSIFNPTVFDKYVKKHICPEYVLRPAAYTQINFPGTSLGAEFCEQDGLIRRIIEQNKLKVAFAHVPRCFHAGFFGYHRLATPHIRKMPWPQQVSKIREIAFDVEKLKTVAVAENLVYDSMPVDLNTSHGQIKKV